MSLAKASTTRPIFIQSFSKIFQKENIKLCLSNLLQALMPLTVISVHSLDHPYCKVNVLFCVILSVAINHNGLPSSTTAFQKHKAYTLSHSSLNNTNLIPFDLLLTMKVKIFPKFKSCYWKTRFMLFRSFSPFSETLQRLQSSIRLLRPDLQLQWKSFSTWNQDTTEIQPEAKQFSQARTCPFSRDTSWHTTCTEEPNWASWQWQQTSFLNSKGSQSAHQSMEMSLASASATENTFQVMQLTSWNQWKKPTSA